MSRSLYNISGEVTPEQYDQVCQDITNQQHIDPKYRLPTFDCPCCGAKKILFAGDKVSKNETILEMFEENGIADYVIICPKCRQYIAVRRHAGKAHEKIRGYFRTSGGKSISYITVYSNRLRGIYHKRPEHEIIFEGEFASKDSVQENDISESRTVYYYTKSYWYQLQDKKLREKFMKN